MNRDVCKINKGSILMWMNSGERDEIFGQVLSNTNDGVYVEGNRGPFPTVLNMDVRMLVD